MSTSTSIDIGGLFSHDEVYTFFSDTFPIFSEETLTEDNKNYLLEAVGYAIGATTDIPDEILKINKGIKGAAFLNRFYDYGKNHHPYGLPSVSYINSLINSNTVSINIEDNTEFYPFLPIKVGGKGLDKDFPDLTLYNGKTLYEHTKELAKTLNLDIDDLVAGLKEGNSNYADTHSAYLFLGANFNSLSTSELSYIFDYFLGKDKNISEILSTTYNPIELLLAETGIIDKPSPDYYRLFKTDGLEIEIYSGNLLDTLIKTSYYYDNMMTEEELDSLTATPTLVYSKNNKKGIIFIRDVINLDTTMRISLQYKEILKYPKYTRDFQVRCIRPYYVLDKQISENEWVRLKIINPRVLVYAGKDDNTSVYTRASINELLEEVSLGNELRIPLERNRVNTYSLNIQEELVLRSICIAIVLRNRESVSWYKTHSFNFWLKNVMFCIQVVLLANGIVSAGWLQLVVSTLIGVAAPFILKAIFEALSPIIGEEAAAVVTIVVAVVAIAYGTDMDTTQLAMAALNMTASVSNIYTQFSMEEIEELQKESALLDSRVDDLLEDIEKIKEGLMPGELSPFALGLLNKKGIVVETPTEFFFRTIHVGNPGVRTLNYPSTFVSNALQLPDLIKEDF